jgi:hypothetical protein
MRRHGTIREIIGNNIGFGTSNRTHTHIISSIILLVPDTSQDVSYISLLPYYSSHNYPELIGGVAMKFLSYS